MINRPFFPPLRIPLSEGICALALIFLLASCSSTTAPVTTKWEGTLEAAPGSRLSGKAAALSQFGYTRASIEIQMADPETALGWRIESASCQGSGLPQGGAASYPVMIPSGGGSASAEAEIGGVLKATNQYSVRVFLFSGSTEGDQVACGDLSLME